MALLIREGAALVLLVCMVLAQACTSDNTPDAAPAAMGDAITPEQQAIQQLTDALSQNPTDASLLAQRGEIYYENNIYDRAIADLRASIQADSSLAPVWHLLADAQLDGLRSREALNTMIYAASRFKERMPTLLKLAEYQYILRKYDDALATLDRAAKLDAGEPEVFFMIGQVLAEAGDTIRAINSYVRATELDADLVDAWLSLGVLHEALGNSIAERYFTTATAVRRDEALPYRMRADYYARRGRLADAVAGYEEAIVRDPRLAEAYFNSGLVLLDMDSIGRAGEQFRRAVAIRPAYADAHYYSGVASELQGDVNAARAGFQQALNLQPNYVRASEALERLQARQ